MGPLAEVLNTFDRKMTELSDDIARLDSKGLSGTTGVEQARYSLEQAQIIIRDIRKALVSQCDAWREAGQSVGGPMQCGFDACITDLGEKP